MNNVQNISIPLSTFTCSDSFQFNDSLLSTSCVRHCARLGGLLSLKSSEKVTFKNYEYVDFYVNLCSLSASDLSARTEQCSAQVLRQSSWWRETLQPWGDTQRAEREQHHAHWRQLPSVRPTLMNTEQQQRRASENECAENRVQNTKFRAAKDCTQ